MANFHDRQKSLFNHLKNAEDQHSFSKSNKITSEQDFNVVDRRTYRKVKHEMKQFRGKESIFKRPDANLRECLRTKTIPGFVKNPKKWVYYSLSDVTQDQMSEKTNTATALAFIREMEEKGSANTDMDVENDDLVFKKPTFHISSAVKKIQKIEDENYIIKNNKIIMPEYVVGVSQKKEKNRATRSTPINSDDTKTGKKADLKLDHLYGDDECLD